MCGVCGCGRPEDPAVEHEHLGPDGTTYKHAHGDGAHGHGHEHEHTGPDGVVFRHEHQHEHEARVLRIEEDILSKNDALARQNRARFDAAGTFAVNLMSSPGAGKTTLLVRTIQALAGRVKVGVIEGDQQTSLDADRIRATGAPAVQINTGRVCHLDAAMVGRALGELGAFEGVLFIENVGNLVCPAGFGLGEHRKVIVASVTEGEDKPLKYPDMFAVADAVVVNKVDLLPYLAFDVAALEANARRLRPGVPIFPVSATTGQGLDAWVAWILGGLSG